jgi:hypothetical protein
MDISNNSLYDTMYEYHRNIRYYTDNIHGYNQNMTQLLNILGRSSGLSMNNIPRYVNQRRDEGNVFRQRFENVVVRPSEAQITRAIETFIYSPMEESHTCPITLEPIQEGDEVCRIRHCGHMFKRPAIEGWFLQNVRCPVCRYDIRDYLEDPSGNQPQEPSILEDLAQETRAFMNRTIPPFRGSPFTNTLTNAIRNFVNNELQNLPVTDTTTELLYSFDIPLSFDASGNYQL